MIAGCSTSTGRSPPWTKALAFSASARFGASFTAATSNVVCVAAGNSAPPCRERAFQALRERKPGREEGSESEMFGLQRHGQLDEPERVPGGLVEHALAESSRKIRGAGVEERVRGYVVESLDR